MTVTIASPDKNLVAAEILRQPYARMILPESDGSFRGEIMEFPGCIVTGDTAGTTLDRLEQAAKAWLVAALERGQIIPDPIETNNEFSGRLILRIPKSLHKKASWIAERDGVSLNQFITASLSEFVGEKQRSSNLIFVQTPTYYSATHDAIGMIGSLSSGGNITSTQSLVVYGTANPYDPFQQGNDGIKPSLVSIVSPKVGRTNASS